MTKLLDPRRPWITAASAAARLSPEEFERRRTASEARGLDELNDRILERTKRRRGRPSLVNLKILPEDFRLDLRYRRHLCRGELPPNALELAAVCPDIFGAVLDKTQQTSTASAALEDWVVRYKRARDRGKRPDKAAADAWDGWGALRLSDLKPEQRAANVSVTRIKRARDRMRPVIDRLAIRTYVQAREKNVTPRTALLAAWRKAGFGGGAVPNDRGVGLSEIKRLLVDAGFSEVADLPFASPRSRMPGRRRPALNFRAC